MPASERSYSEVFQEIIFNIQDMVRSEVRLAKTEIRDEATKAKSAGLLIGAGAVCALFAALFLLLGIVDALSIVMPNWAAASSVAAGLAIGAMATLSAGLKDFKKIHPTPQKTVESVKENVEWTKQQIK